MSCDTGSVVISFIAGRVGRTQSGGGGGGVCQTDPAPLSTRYCTIEVSQPSGICCHAAISARRPPPCSCT